MVALVGALNSPQFEGELQWEEPPADWPAEEPYAAHSVGFPTADENEPTTPITRDVQSRGEEESVLNPRKPEIESQLCMHEAREHDSMETSMIPPIIPTTPTPQPTS